MNGKIIAVIAAVIVAVLMVAGAAASVSMRGTTTTTSAPISTPATSSSSEETTTTSILQTIQSTSSLSQSLQSAAALEAGTAICNSMNGLPDPNCTPGATDANVTQDTISSTICVSGWTETVRPSESYTNSLKIASIKDYGYANTNLSSYEEDHFIPLELGGSPTSVYNLWAQPHYGNYTSFEKDVLETYLKTQVCDGAMTLAQARQSIVNNWISAYQTCESSSSSASVPS